MVDLEAATSRVLDRSEANRIRGIAWSPDGCWLAYGFATSLRKTAIKLCHVETGEVHQVTEPVLHDIQPSFDPEGKYLYFLGYRIFHPTYDHLQFDLGFPRGIKPYAIMLRRNLRSPFIPEPKVPKEKDKGKDEEGEKEKDDASKNAHREEDDDTKSDIQQEDDEQKGDKKDQSKKKPTPMVIDLEGISERVLPSRSLKGVIVWCVG